MIKKMYRIFGQNNVYYLRRNHRDKGSSSAPFSRLVQEHFQEGRLIEVTYAIVPPLHLRNISDQDDRNASDPVKFQWKICASIKAGSCRPKLSQMRSGYLPKHNRTPAGTFIRIRKSIMEGLEALVSASWHRRVRNSFLLFEGVTVIIGCF